MKRKLKAKTLGTLDPVPRKLSRGLLKVGADLFYMSERWFDLARALTDNSAVLARDMIGWGTASAR